MCKAFFRSQTGRITESARLQPEKGCLECTNTQIAIQQLATELQFGFWDSVFGMDVFKASLPNTELHWYVQMFCG